MNIAAGPWARVPVRTDRNDGCPATSANRSCCGCGFAKPVSIADRAPCNTCGLRQAQNPVPPAALHTGTAGVRHGARTRTCDPRKAYLWPTKKPTSRWATRQRRRFNEKSPPDGGLSFGTGSPGWIRTTECLSQSQVPYRLATGLWNCDAAIVTPKRRRQYSVRNREPLAPGPFEAISASRTGWRDGPCADRSSCAPLRGHRGS